MLNPLKNALGLRIRRFDASPCQMIAAKGFERFYGSLIAATRVTAIFARYRWLAAVAATLDLEGRWRFFRETFWLHGAAMFWLVTPPRFGGQPLIADWTTFPLHLPRTPTMLSFSNI
jgi:hypothetical protein